MEKEQAILNEIINYVNELSTNPEEEKIVLDSLKDTIMNRKNKNDIVNLGKVYEEFKKAPADLKRHILTTVLGTIPFHANYYQKQIGEYHCNLEGHQFTPWEEFTTEEEEYVDCNRFKYNYNSDIYGTTYYKNVTKKREWRRYCKRCSYVEISEEMPRSVEAARERSRKRARIKELKAELKELEKES